MRWVRRSFGYSRGEARGLAGLLGIMLLIMVAPILLRPELPTYLPAADQKGVDELAAQLKEHRTVEQGFAGRYPKREYRKFERRGPRFPAVPQVRLSPFDPNSPSPPT